MKVKRTMLKYKQLSVAVLFITFLLFFNLSVASGEQDDVLMNGTGIFLTTGNSWTFSQGYVLTVKDANPENNEAWIQLSINGTLLKEDIMKEGSYINYVHGKEILNITLDTIYSNPTGELLTFKPVYQYLDPLLSVPGNVSVDNPAGSNNSSQAENDVHKSIPGFGILSAIFCLILVGMNKRGA